MEETITLDDLCVAYDAADDYYWSSYFSQYLVSDFVGLAADRHDAAFNYLYWAKAFDKVVDKKIYKILTERDLYIISKRQKTRFKKIRIKLVKPVFI